MIFYTPLETSLNREQFSVPISICFFHPHQFSPQHPPSAPSHTRLAVKMAFNDGCNLRTKKGGQVLPMKNRHRLIYVGIIILARNGGCAMFEQDYQELTCDITRELQKLNGLQVLTLSSLPTRRKSKIAHGPV